MLPPPPPTSKKKEKKKKKKKERKKKIYSNKKETSDFHGTVSFDPAEDVATKIKPKCLSNVGHTKIGNYLLLSFNLEGLVNLMCIQLFLL